MEQHPRKIEINTICKMAWGAKTRILRDKLYSSEEFTKLASDCKHLINELAEGKPEHELVALEDIVVKTSRFEYMFWDMAEDMSMWPTDEIEQAGSA